MNILLTLSTWIHVTSAVILVGGVFFFRFLLLKYAGRLEGGLSDELRGILTKRWLHTAGMLLLVLLVTGLYNMSQKNAAWLESTAPLSPHAVFGVKFLLFLGVVGISVAATVPKMASKRPLLLTINAVLGLTIVFLSAVLSNSY